VNRAFLSLIPAFVLLWSIWKNIEVVVTQLDAAIPRTLSAFCPYGVASV
jgi:hypothetical protein